MITPEKLSELSCTQDASPLAEKINDVIEKHAPQDAWQILSQHFLTQSLPFKIHHFIFSILFPHWQDDLSSAPAWIPSTETIHKTNLFQALSEKKFPHYADFHTWSITHIEAFWEYVITKLNIHFIKKSLKTADFSKDLEQPVWFPDAKINIVDSCLRAEPDKLAILFQHENGKKDRLTYGNLNSLVNKISNSLKQWGFNPGDAIAIDMPMNAHAIAIYLGIIKMGGVVVSIADSFSPEEIAIRLRIAKAKAIFTQDFILRDQKKLPLYEKVMIANAPKAIVLPSDKQVLTSLRENDLDWSTFLVGETSFHSHPCDPMKPCNILFSSGTTAEPKAIPWNHTTAIKAACDAYFHQDIHSDDILTWPTNLGWMMGPWLIFAALINQATIALYEGPPSQRAFGEFIQDNNVSFLGVVPTLVASWRQSHCMENLDWKAIRLFSSTGECSNPDDMLYLMYLAGYKPIIEYCGGTEIGGGYVTSTLIQNNYPSVFSTAALGIHFVLLDENRELSNAGEVALIPPSLGLSTTLLNADHHRVYYENMPTFSEHALLRRHGDQLYQFPNGFYRVLGRADDAMNLSGIKISAVEIECTLAGIDDILETAAIAHSDQAQGPSQLIIFAATQKELNVEKLKLIMQKKINEHLNPLFKIKEVILIKELPKTASNKIMRRTLRAML